MVNNIIQTYDLTKIYKLKGQSKEICALNNVNINIEEGEIFGLLGANGAGKTTLVQILSTLLQPTSGYAIIEGYNILKRSMEIKKRIGLMLGSNLIYHRITGYDNLKFFCKIYGIYDYKKKISEITRDFQLEDWLNQYVEKYSLGMKIKLALCRALLIDPKILYLDEPTLGLDVSNRLFVIDKLKELKKTILLTSHNMYVVEKLCKRIAFINHGKILKIGNKDDLKRLMKSEITVIIDIIDDKKQLKDELSKIDVIKEVTESKNSLIITLKERKAYQQLFSILSKYPGIQKINEKEISLENLFMNYMENENITQ
ncbi:MAG: ATP-binding cassette domain-containing protein [Candidatus Hodarchaeota archaeon]